MIILPPYLSQALRLLAAAIGLLVAAGTARADIFRPLDDYSDGNDEGWRHFDQTQGRCPMQTVFDASSGEYQMGTPCSLAANTTGVIGAIYEPEIDRPFTEGTFGVRLRHLTPWSNAWLTMRSWGNEEMGLYGYRFIVAPNGRQLMIKWIGDPVGEVILAASAFHEPLFERGDDVQVEAGAVGDRITLKVWKAGTAEPAYPQLVAQNGAITNGELAMGVSHFGDEGPMGVAFDDVYFLDPSAPGDVDDDGLANFNDVLAILANWGFCEGCPEDLNFDGAVDFADVLIVLTNWSR